MDTPESLKSRLYRLEQHNEEDIWVEKCQGYPIFKKQDSIFKLKYYSLPNRDLFYDIVVNSNIRFDKNENGVEWIQIRQGEIMAISFKEEFQANAFWNLIDEYQRKYEVSVPAASGTHFYFEYRVPDPTVDNLPEFLAELERIPEAERHERLTSILLTKREFLPRLAAVFKQLEKQSPLPRNKLELVFTILKIIFNSSNEELLYELMCDEFFLFVLGGLEYDPNFRNSQPKHREFMLKSKLNSVVQFRNHELLNLSVITYRLEYVRQCILLPYLNDYSFTFTNHIVRNNYRKILSHIFNPRKKDFINEVFDQLRKQEPNAFKLLREIFRIGKSFYAEDLYLQIAERDFFEIMMKTMKDLRDLHEKKPEAESQVQAQTIQSKYKRKKKPEHIAECVEISIEILQQFMEFQPLHFKNFCVSESEVINKYGTINFLLEQFESESMQKYSSQIEIVLKILATDKDNHPIKEIIHGKIIEKIFTEEKFVNLSKWIPILNKMLIPMNPLVKEKAKEIFDLFFKNLMRGSKQNQINLLQTLKNIITIYIDGEEAINEFLKPFLEKFVDYFRKSKASHGIRISIFLSIFKAPMFNKFTQDVIDELEKEKNPLLEIYLSTLKQFLGRKEIVLPSNLRRDRSQQLKDDECFEKIEKMIKID